jgi:hypothetical protein
VGNTESVLPVTVLLDGLQVEKDIVSAAATPPPVPGAFAPAGREPAEDFELLWLAYDYRVRKKEARAEFDRMAPDADVLGTLIASAHEWHQAAEAGNVTNRYTLESWLKDGRWDEDPHQRYQKSAKARTARKPREPANDDSYVPPQSAPVRERHVVTITGSKLVDCKDGTVVSIAMKDADRHPHFVDIDYEHDDPQIEDEGRRRLARLCKAIGLEEFDDTDQLHDATLIMVREGGVFDFFKHVEPLPANENAVTIDKEGAA